MCSLIAWVYGGNEKDFGSSATVFYVNAGSDNSSPTMLQMTILNWLAILLALTTNPCVSIQFDPDQVLWNLNQNETATDVMNYWGKWDNHSKQHSDPAIQAVLKLIIRSVQSLARKLALPILHADA